MYPKDVYHKTLGVKTIYSAAEEHEDWLDNPGMFLPEDHFEYVKPVLKKLSVKEAVAISESQEIHVLSEEELPKHKADLSESLDHELGKVKPSKKKGK